MREERSLSADRADELSLGVKDQDFAIGAKNEHEPREFRHDALLDLLLDVNALFELECTLVHFPDFDA